jgi:hypothetical protein
MTRSSWSWFGFLKVILRAAAIATGGLSLVRDLLLASGAVAKTNDQFWIWLQISFVAAFVGEWLAQHTELRSKERRIVELENRFKAQPRIIPVANPLRPDAFNIIDHNSGMVYAYDVACIRLRMINDPVFPGADSEATGVRASITFLKPGGTEFTMDGRWADAPQHGERLRSSDITTVMSVPFPVRQERSLDIAFKFRDDAECYAVNDSSFQWRDLRVPEFVLPVGRIIVSARFSGKFVDTTVNFDFVNEGVGGAFSAGGCTYVNNLP